MTFPRPETWCWTKWTMIDCLTCRSNGLMGRPWPMKAEIYSRPSAVSLKVWLRDTTETVLNQFHPWLGLNLYALTYLLKLLTSDYYTSKAFNCVMKPCKILLLLLLLRPSLWTGCFASWCFWCFTCIKAKKYGECLCLPLLDLCGFVPPITMSIRVSMRQRYGIKVRINQKWNLLHF